MIHKGQVGAVIRLTSNTDLSDGTSFEIRYIKPSGTRGAWPGSLEGTTDVQYMTVAEDDLNESGPWQFQGFATYGDGTTGVSTRVTSWIESIIEEA